jgi:hypothetical protein
MFAPSLLLIASATLAAPALALQSLAARSPARAELAGPPAPDSAAVQAALERADEAAIEGRSKEARKLLRALVDEQRNADQFAGEAMWRLALNYLYADDTYRAAATLDELADAADSYGAPAMELRASFEAAALWMKLRRPELAVPRLEQAKKLLQSPVISEEDKQFVKSRMGLRPLKGKPAW